MACWPSRMRSTGIDWGAAGAADDQISRPAHRRNKPTLLWDGEWEVTYVTFRDMGAAFMVAILGIYILVVAQFGSSSCRS